MDQLDLVIQKISGRIILWKAQCTSAYIREINPEYFKYGWKVVKEVKKIKYLPG